MADLVPTASIAVADDRQAFGVVTSPDQAVSWDLRAYLDYGSGGAAFSGLALDPTRRYVCQAGTTVALDADPPQWSGLTGGTFSFGTDSGGTGAGKKFLRGQATGTDLLMGVSLYTRQPEEGLALSLYRSAVGAGVASDFFLLFQPSGGTGPQYRLAFVPNFPIRLQASQDGENWTDLQAAGELGECESYLDSRGRGLSLTVIPMTDPTWAAGLPQSAATSGPPPSLLVININNGDSILSVPASTFPADFLVGFSAHGGQIGLRLGRWRYAVSASAALPPQVRARDFATAPTARFQGYTPFGTVLAGQITTDGHNQAAGTLTLNAAALADSTGLSAFTVFLSTLDADFPAGQIPPSAVVDWVDYTPQLENGGALCQAAARLSWDQKTGTLRSSGSITLYSEGGALAPGAGVALGVRAGALGFGYRGFDDFPDFRSGLQAVLTGWTGLDPGGGQEWSWNTFRNFVRISVHDKLRRGDADQVACGYRLPDDGENHYYAVRTALHQLGITDDWMNFPLRERGDNTPYEFYLPRGTTQEPMLLAHPSTPINSHLELIRNKSGVYSVPNDPTSQILPMALGTDPQGGVDYFGLPVGVVNAFSGPGAALAPLTLTPAITFGGPPAFWPDGSPMLNEILADGLETRATLTNIRTDIVCEGLDLTGTGGAVVGVAKDEALGGPYADPNVPGYVSVPVPFYDIDRVFSSPEVAAVSAALAALQLQFPAIEARLKVHLQPWLVPLTIIAVDDFATTGSDSPVYFYVTEVMHEYNGLTNPAQPTGHTRITARLLGQAG